MMTSLSSVKDGHDDGIAAEEEKEGLKFNTAALNTKTRTDSDPNSSIQNLVKPVAPDGGYGWVIVVCVLFNLFFFAGTVTSFSVLLIAFKDAYPNQSTGTLSLLLSLRLVVIYTGSLFASAPMKLYGLRATLIAGLLVAAIALATSCLVNTLAGLFATFTVLTGLGLSVCLPPSLMIVQMYFDKRRPLAAGIASSGLSIAALLMPVVTQFLLDKFTLNGVLLLLSGFILQGVVFAVLYRPLPGGKKAEKKTLTLRKTVITVAKDALDFSLLKNIRFTLYIMSAGFLHVLGIYGILTHTPSRLVWRGVSRDMAALSMFFIGVAGLLSRIVYSVVSNLKCTNRTSIYGCSLIAGGILCILSVFVQEYWSFVVLMSCFGVFISGCHALQVTVMVDMFGKEDMAHKTSLLSTATGFGGLLGVFLTGWLSDMLESYDSPFYVLGVMHLLAGVILLSLMVYNQHQLRQGQTQDVSTDVKI